MKKYLVITALSTSLAISSHAASIFSDSFESPDVTGRSDTLPTGWDVPGTDPLNGDAAVERTNRIGTYQETGATTGDDNFTTPFGEQVAWVHGDNYNNYLITNDTGLSATVAADTVYTLTWNVGSDNGDSGLGTRGYKMRLLAGNSTVLAGGSFTFLENQDLSATDSLSFTTSATPANLGETLRIRMEADGPNSLRDDILFDNLELDASVIPEPSVALLGGLGILALLRRRR